jgi:hypothetical protein
VPRGCSGYRTAVEILADRVSDHRGPVAPGNGRVQLLAQFVVEGHGDADGHASDSINGTAGDTTRDPIGVARLARRGVACDLGFLD